MCLRGTYTPISPADGQSEQLKQFLCIGTRKNEEEGPIENFRQEGGKVTYYS